MNRNHQDDGCISASHQPPATPVPNPHRQKNRPQDLAIFGGRPAFCTPLHVGRPNLANGEDFLARVRAVLDRGWLTNNGPFVQELETRLSPLLGGRHCVAMANGTQAIELMLRGAGISGEVIVPAFTFVATAHAVTWAGLTPVLADVDPESHNLTPATIEPHITSRTGAILAVHLWGRAGNAADLERFGKERNLPVFFDAAHAFGCSAGGRPVGALGRASAFSFHATKCFHTLEGGAVTTDDPSLAERLCLLRNFGFAGFDRVVSEGTNAKMNELSAAMGLTQLDTFAGTLAWNFKNYEAYRRRFKTLPGLKLLSYPKGERMNYHYIVIEINERKTGLSRDALVQVLMAENVVARRYFTPGVHRMEPYRSQARHAGISLPITERLADILFCLPTGMAISEEEIDVVGDILQAALSEPARVRTVLAKRGAR